MPPVEHLLAAVLDTHAWVWLSAGDARAQALREFRGTPVVSAISLWEVAMLAQKGRLELLPDTGSWIAANLAHPVSLEPLSPAICVESCRLPEFHGDPADRLIVATALTLGVPLVTADRGIIDWNARHSRVQLVAL